MNDNKIEKSIEQTLQAQASIGSSYHKHGSYFNEGRGGQNHGGAWRGERGGGGREDIYNKSNVECYNCHKRGHYANECRSKGDNHAVNCAQEESNHVQDEEYHTILMATTSIRLGIWIQVARIICVVRRSCLQIWMTHFAQK